jgi:hypothetical protein
MNTYEKTRQIESGSEVRELTQTELMSVSGGAGAAYSSFDFFQDVWNSTASVRGLPRAGNGDCGTNHNGV